MASSIAPSPLNEFELQRLKRIAENRRRMEECGVLDAAKSLAKSMKAISKPPIRRTPKERKRKTRHQPVRRSGRLSGAPAEYGEVDEERGEVTYSDCEPGLKDLLAGDAEIENLSEEKQVQFQEMRCASAAGRGSMYDSVVGITCHFCRQKKLCGEEDCPRCSRHSISSECIGKSDCSRCHSATGRFCRACLLIRYGQNLEEVREEMASGTWLCPHCYEDEHPEEGWMCNSSICMKRRGFKPTGIAIYDAQQRGFPSVAHWLQSQLHKSNAADAAVATAAADGAAATTSKPVSSSGSNDSSDADTEAETAAAAGTSSPAAAGVKKPKSSAAAAAAGVKKHKGAAAADILSSQESRQGGAAGDDAQGSQGTAVAPGTPTKACEGTPGPGATAAGGGVGGAGRGGSGRTTRSSAAAAAAAGSKAAAGGADVSEPASKRAWGVCTLKSLRFRS